MSTATRTAVTGTTVEVAEVAEAVEVAEVAEVVEAAEVPAGGRSGADLLVGALRDAGTELVFGMPGGAILPAYDALFEECGFRHVLIRHEHGAGFAAIGHAQATGGTGVCMVTSGPGATNVVAAVAAAWHDEVPLVVITGQVPKALMGTDAFQEVDICGVTRPISRHSFLVTRAEDIPARVADAFRIAAGEHPGPVLVDITKDALMSVPRTEDVRKPAPASAAPASAEATDSGAKEVEATGAASAAGAVPVSAGAVAAGPGQAAAVERLVRGLGGSGLVVAGAEVPREWVAAALDSAALDSAVLDSAVLDSAGPDSAGPDSAPLGGGASPRWCNSGVAMAGYAIPAALGARMGAPERDVWAVVGEGCFHVAGRELVTAATHGVPLRVLVLRGADGPVADVAGMAEAFGCVAFRCGSAAELDVALDKAASVDDLPVLVDCTAYPAPSPSE